MEHDNKIPALQIEYIYRNREQNHSELDLYDAMGKFIYFINDGGDIDRETLTGISIKDDWNGSITFYHEVPEGHRKKFIILTASCWEFDLDSFGKEWFLDEETAITYLNKQKR